MNPVCIISKNENAAVAFLGRIQSLPSRHRLIASVDKEVLKEVVMFDLYQGKKIDENKKSMSFRMKFQSGQKTLVDEEVDSIMSKVVTKLEREFNAVQR